MTIKYDIPLMKFSFGEDSKAIYDYMKRYAAENNLMVKDRDGTEHPLSDDIKKLEGFHENQVGRYAAYIHMCNQFKMNGIKEGDKK